MSAMNDDDLSHLLKELPRHEASPAFTDRVLARLDEPPKGSLIGTRRGLALAAAAMMIVGIWLGAAAWRDRAEQREIQRVRMMRDEYRELEVELEELRTLAREAQPVLDLGGSEQVDFVFDLRRHAQERGAIERPRAQPMSHTPR